MKGIFIYYKNINYDNLTGIDKKVLWQVDALKENGIHCDIVVIDKYKNYSKKTSLKKLLDQIIISLPYGNVFPKWKYLKEFDDIDYIYLRRPTCFTFHMLRVLKKIKVNNPNVKIILEIPTYPYDKELQVKLRYLPLLIKDKYNRLKLHDVVDRIAVQNDIDNIFGVPTLNFTNGIKVDDLTIRAPIEKNTDEINLCAIASLNPWQGYERVIQGIFNYYKNGGKRKIVLHLVGDGTERQRYEKLVKSYQLENNVKIYGRLYGDDLNYIYDISSIALDAFGRYKTENGISTSLKSREYLAKGLPIVAGCKVDIIKENTPYYLEFPNNDSIIDINRIIQFHDKIYKSNESTMQISKKIRDYAYEVCDVSNTMKKIVQYINK
ncbi:glycosyltransferase family 4 protein [Desulfotomaculum defluvii]